ncbi:MAG: hypothetical protein IT426_07775 [Pirellulales bacterium]|nr:hypothetical protein [Pirellulales bacterium]
MIYSQYVRSMRQSTALIKLATADDAGVLGHYFASTTSYHLYALADKGKVGEMMPTRGNAVRWAFFKEEIQQIGARRRLWQGGEGDREIAG